LQAGESGASDVKVFLLVIILAVVVLAGLFTYGQLLQPETRTIEQEAASAGA
jgi:hypothetical protein